MKTLSALDIINIIETPHEISQTHNIVRHTPVREVLKALGVASKPLTKQVLCDILGYQHAKSGVMALIAALDDPGLKVRCAAAESLGKIGEPRAGKALLHHFLKATELAERTSLAVALGAVRHEPALPALMTALQDENESLRGCAAWSLGELHAQEALTPLKQALANEQRPYPKARMQEAIARLSGTAA